MYHKRNVVIAWGAVIIFISCFYIFIRYRHHLIAQQPRFRNKNTRYKQNFLIPSGTSNSKQYDDIFCTMKGKWIRIPYMTEKNREDVLIKNTEIRRRKGWATVLYKSDHKCGKGNSINNNGLPIAAQCDVVSDKPCCSAEGACSTNCTCSGCIDYPSIVYPELYQWKPSSPGCDIKKINQTESCEFLSEHFTSVTLVGDSLIRHLYTAMLIHLTGDYQIGALSSRFSETAQLKCQYELQFGETECRGKIPLLPRHINAKYCNRLKNKIDIWFSESYDVSLAKQALEFIKPRFDEDRPLIILGIGLHDNLNAVAIQKGYLQPILDLKSKYNHLNAVFVWANLHYGGLLKPLQYESFQGNHIVKPFNEAMKIFCKDNGVHVFETFELTRGVFSFDGQHYGSSLHKVKIQSLIKGLLKLNNSQG